MDDDAMSTDPFSVIERVLFDNSLSEDKRQIVKQIHEQLSRIAAE